MAIQMVDLCSQYLHLKDEIDKAVLDVFHSADFINGAPVHTFCKQLADYLNTPFVIPCGNGTDALRIALQALHIGADDEVILSAFTYIAPLEAVASVAASPVVVDVDPSSFNINPNLIERAITTRTKAIIVVHLFGQSCDMEPIQRIADKHKLFVIEDNAQSLGATYLYSNGQTKKLGTIGTIGTTSFFPTKPLACYGDGGAIFTSDKDLASHIRLLANHGQTKKYHHTIIGCNSRLDTVQAAILLVKLKYMNVCTNHRTQLANHYDQLLHTCPEIILPEKSPRSSHVYHQYTIRVQNNQRDLLKSYLAEKGIPSMIYYPLPVHEQDAYQHVVRLPEHPVVAEQLCREVLSLPIHSEMTTETQSYIIATIQSFFNTSH